MKSNTKLFGVLLAAAALVATAAQADDKPAATNAAPATNAPAISKLDQLFPDPVIAKGKGFEIKRGQLDDAVSSYRNAAVARGQQIAPEDMPLIERGAYEHLLELELLKIKATDADRAKATAEVDKELASVQTNAATAKAFALQLKSQNITLDDLRKRLIQQASAVQVLRDKVTVTDDQVRKYYDENPSQFEQPEMVRASQILILTVDKTGAPLPDDDKKAKRKIIDDLLKRARAGEDFTKLAKENSDDPGAKDNDGEYTFPRGRMPKEIEAAAFTMQTNQISDVVSTQYGYDIIKLSEKIPAKKLDFPGVESDIRIHLEGLEIEKILPQIVADLKKDADVQILDEQLKTLEAAAEAEAKAKAAAPKDSTPPIALPK